MFPNKMIYKGRHHDIFAEPKNLVVPGIGFVLTLSAGCGLAIVHFATETVLFVITSYSIHYTKLYEISSKNSVTVSAMRRPTKIVRMRFKSW